MVDQERIPLDEGAQPGAAHVVPSAIQRQLAKFDADGKLHRIIGFTPATLDGAAAA